MSVSLLTKIQQRFYIIIVRDHDRLLVVSLDDLAHCSTSPNCVCVVCTVIIATVHL